MKSFFTQFYFQIHNFQCFLYMKFLEKCFAAYSMTMQNSFVRHTLPVTICILILNYNYHPISYSH